ncbi:MAG: tripartite tricarboxylate transporter substrate binding protein [Burkholderiales bacterium]|nr:tripartite tricarboxylate transporter substrate binding protein [Burkholderiales bacterium]MDP2399222.1 tripartite tricarboxylate transporter substrate binding protein [Burkholderiales bacterium]
MIGIKQILISSAAAIATLAGTAAQAQAYPSKPVRFVVTYPAGGSSDVMARIIGKKLTELWGQNVLVDSRPGAAGAVGMEYAAKQAPDGHTFLLGNFGPVLANPLLNKVKYDVDKDFVPVGQITRAANILVTPNTLPVRNVKDVIALAKKQPGVLTYATSGPGSMSHLVGEMFKRAAQVDIVTVPFQGGVYSIAAVQGGHIMLMFSDAPPVMGNIKAGKLKALAVTSGQRTPFNPDLPTLAEQGLKGFDAANWWGIMFPAGVQRSVVDKVSADLKIALNDAEVKKNLGTMAIEAVYSSPEEFGAFIKSERKAWGDVIREAKIGGIQ